MMPPLREEQDFEELLASFLLDEDPSEGEALFDALNGTDSEEHHATFQQMTRMHRALADLYEVRKRRRAKFARIGFVGTGAAAAVLVAILFFHSRRSPEVERISSLQFGECTVKEARTGTTLSSASLSICEYTFKSPLKGKPRGRTVRIRLMPDSGAEIQLIDNTWVLVYRKGTILIASTHREPSQESRDHAPGPGSSGQIIPERLKVMIGDHAAEFLGTSVRIQPAMEQATLIEVLQGIVAITPSGPAENAKGNPATELRAGFGVILGKSGALNPTALTETDRQSLAEAFASFEGIEVGATRKQADPHAILFPKAARVPGNRLVLKNGTVYRGTSLLQNGDIYILLSKEGAREFPAADIERIEFE